MATSNLPEIVPVPPSTIRLGLAPQEWEVCLDTWLTLTDLYLRSPVSTFSTGESRTSASIDFLRSFYREAAHADPKDTSFHSATARNLRKACFKLTHRLCIESSITPKLLDFEFLGDFCHVHARSASLSKLMKQLWNQHEKTLRASMDKKKPNLITSLDSSSDQMFQSDSQALARIFLASPDIATYFMIGSDFLDALAARYRTTGSPDVIKSLTAVTYLGLESLVKTDPPNMSLLIDHLYSLKAQADRNGNGPSLVADLVTNTNLLSVLRRQTGQTAGERLSKLLDTLQTYRSSAIARPKNHAKRKPSKGKGKSVQYDQEMHMHRMSLITQIQDLFPDLGSGFVLKLLDEYSDDVEQVTAHLLDDSLPPHLQRLDRTEQAPINDFNAENNLDHLVPRSTPPLPEPFVPERRNVFDNDAFDRLEVDTGKLHLGKRENQLTKDQANKAAILSALAAFDSDDDERDDTYDVEDVGGTVDTAHPDGEPGPVSKVTHEENDMALFTVFKSSPHLFARTPEVRRGQPRQALKMETGMTDEAIEGWAIMLQRDPKRLQRLEAQAGSFDGQQHEVARTSYREGGAGTETEDSDGPANRGGYRGRGRGRGRGGRGRGNVSGPSSDPKTAAAQRNKEANKSSRANHNRRDQRARKMARGGFPG